MPTSSLLDFEMEIPAAPARPVDEDEEDAYVENENESPRTSGSTSATAGGKKGSKTASAGGRTTAGSNKNKSFGAGGSSSSSAEVVGPEKKNASRSPSASSSASGGTTTSGKEGAGEVTLFNLKPGFWEAMPKFVQEAARETMKCSKGGDVTSSSRSDAAPTNSSTRPSSKSRKADAPPSTSSTTASARSSEQSQCAAFVFAKNLTQHVSSVTRDLLVDAVIAQRALRGKSVSTGTPSSNVGKDSKGGLFCSPSSGWGNFFCAADTAAGGGTTVLGAGGRFGGSVESEEDQRQAILDGLKTAPGEYFIPIPQNESMAHVKLIARKVLRENGFGAHECDAILYRNQFQHLKGVAIKCQRLFSPERVQELRTM